MSLATATPPRLLMRPHAGGIRWAVVAANGRVMGVSAGGFADADAATADFRGLCGLLPDLPVSFGRQGGSREWTWRVGDTGSGHIAVSAHAYERHATSRAAFGRFREATEVLCATRPARPGQR